MHNKPRHATPTSRRATKLSRIYNIKPVVDVRSRFHEKDCQPAIEIYFASFS
jgi:hypothetical protein